MEINDPLVIMNVVVCTLVVFRLSFFSKNGATHRRWASWLAYLLILIYGHVPLRFLFDHYDGTRWAIFLLNIVICIAVFAVRGNVAKLFSALRHQQ
ncbi:phage holin family protein [Rouxiella badensis]|uniref:phage holin family protein n=1 Tax=Rouxiella badensis TaxID=1646377 RepID=UPI003C65D8CC